MRGPISRTRPGAVHGAAAGPGLPLHLRRNGDRVGRLVRQVDVRQRHGRAVRPRRARRRSTPPRARSASAPRRSASYWYPVEARSATRCSASSTRSRTRRRRRRNGGIMIRAPTALHGREHRRRARPEADRLQLRRLRRARWRSAAARRPAPSTTYKWAGAPGPFPPASNASRPAVRVLGRLLRAPPARTTYNVNGRQRPAADRQRQRQQPPALDAGLLRPRDPDQRVAHRRRPEPVDRPDQDRLDLRLPQPQRQAVAAPTSASTRASGTSTRSARSASSTRS